MQLHEPDEARRAAACGRKQGGGNSRADSCGSMHALFDSAARLALAGAAGSGLV